MVMDGHLVRTNIMTRELLGWQHLIGLKIAKFFIKNAKPIGGATTRRRAMKREERRWLRLLQEMGS
jgi:hypothetical protein